MVPHNIEADVEVRNRVPQGSRSHSGHAEIVTAVSNCSTYCTTTGEGCRTNHSLCSVIVLHAKHTAINRRSPLRIPPMFVGGVERPYGGELYTGAGAEYALLRKSKSQILAGAKHRPRSP